MAESIASGHVRGREEELRLVSGQILDRRRSSLEESTERQLDKQRELLADARRNGYASIVRLREGTIRKLEAALPAKVAEIEALRGVEIGRELVAGGILSVRHA